MGYSKSAGTDRFIYTWSGQMCIGLGGQVEFQMDAWLYAATMSAKKKQTGGG